MKQFVKYLTLLLASAASPLLAEYVTIDNNSLETIRIYRGNWTQMPTHDELSATTPTAILKGTRGHTGGSPNSLTCKYTPGTTALVIVHQEQGRGVSSRLHYGVKIHIPLSAQIEQLQLSYNGHNFEWGGVITHIEVNVSELALRAGITWQQYYYHDAVVPTIVYKREIKQGRPQPIHRLVGEGQS